MSYAEGLCQNCDKKLGFLQQLFGSQLCTLCGKAKRDAAGVTKRIEELRLRLIREERRLGSIFYRIKRDGSSRWLRKEIVGTKARIAQLKQAGTELERQRNSTQAYLELLMHHTELARQTEYGEYWSWSWLRELIRRRDGDRCVECGASSSKLHVHHAIPLSQGGTNDPDNLTSLCESCHAKKHLHLERLIGDLERTD